MDERFPPEVAVTTQQLTALKHVLDTGREPCADFSVFVPHAQRYAKRSTLAGAMFDAKGVLRDIEIYGPATIEACECSYNCLTTAMIMPDAVSRANLAKYKQLVLLYSAQFGPAVWHLLYQVDVRCRQELMSATHYELLDTHNTALAQGKNSSFDVNKPWDTVWEKVTSNHDWWRVEFETPAMMVLAHTKTLASTLA